MNIRRSVALLLLTVLLVVASEVLAASAWVLWVREERFWDPKGEPKGERWGAQKSSWDVLGAASSETECRRKLRETIARVTQPEFPPKDQSVMYKVTGDTVEFLFYPKDGRPTDTMTGQQILTTSVCPTRWTRASREGGSDAEKRGTVWPYRSNA